MLKLKQVLWALRGRAPSPETGAFRRRALAALREAEQRDQAWVASAVSTSDYGALANLAAVYRWELALVSHHLAALDPPEGLAQEAAECRWVIDSTARAFHRMTSGYRFSKFERVCDGQTLLEEARKNRARLIARLENCLQEHTPDDNQVAKPGQPSARVITRR